MTIQDATGLPMLLDVDTGVDDALAMALAVRSGARLVGATTVAGNVPIDPVLQNTLSVLSWIGAESVPVHRGAARPLAVPSKDAVHVHGGDGLGGASLGGSRAHPSRVNGVQALIDAAELYMGELVVVAVGPLTNVAMALSLRPEITRQIRRLVIMSGAFHVSGNVTPHAEFNAYADPHAAAQVMSAEWNDLIAVGLDVTHQTVISRDQWEGIEPDGSATAELVRQIAGRTFTERGMEGFYLHDPLAVAVALDDSLVETEASAVDVATEGLERGRTTPDGSGVVRVATSVDAERFEREFAQLLDIPQRSAPLNLSRTE